VYYTITPHLVVHKTTTIAPRS